MHTTYHVPPSHTRGTGARCDGRVRNLARMLPGLWLALIAVQAHAASAHLVRDINTVIVPMSSYPESVGTFRGLFLFNATDAVGRGLWRTDGTRAGTSLLGRFGQFGVFSPNPPSLVEFGSFGYFPVFDVPSNTAQLWRTDGTAGGTQRAVSFPPNPDGQPLQIYGAVASSLYVAAHDASGTLQLYATDGSAAGTRQLTSFASPPAGVADGIFPVGPRVYFVATDNQYAHQLWVTDGTAAGTHQIEVPLDLQAAQYNPHAFRLAGTQVFFESSGLLWTLDPNSGTVGAVTSGYGTPGFGPPYVLESAGLVDENGFVLFVSTSPPGPLELWRSDGTSAGTYRIANITVGQPTFDQSQYPLFQKLGSRAVYVADDGTSGLQLWSSDGTPANTIRLTNSTQPPSPAPFPPVVPLATIGNRMYFLMPDGASALTVRLWVTDGTPAGTQRVDGIPALEPSNAGSTRIAGDGTKVFVGTVSGTTGSLTLYVSDPRRNQATLLRSGLEWMGTGDPFVFDGTRLEFSSTDPVRGDEPWVSDGTPGGTGLLRDINPEVADAASNPQEFVRFRGRLAFSADDGVHGRELWTSDGTSAGTSLLVDVAPGSAASNPNHLITTASGDLYYFATDTSGHSRFMRLPARGGAPAVLATVSPQPDGAPYCQQDAPVTLGNKVYFGADDGATGYELWVSDGTAAGTKQLADIYPGVWGSNPCWLTVAGGRVYFSAVSPEGGFELWATDGTEGGTHQVADIAPGAADSFPYGLTAIGNLVYFSADDGVHGTEIWRSDGTRRGTSLVVDLVPGPDTSYPMVLGALDGRLILSQFVLTDPQAGTYEPQLWTTTLQGRHATRLGSFRPALLTTPLIDDGRLYFAASDARGMQVWVSDGTTSGSRPLTTFSASANARPLWFERSDDAVVFAIPESTTSAQLWGTDGSRAGTSLLGRVPTLAPADSNPKVLPLGRQRLSVGEQFFFTATQPSIGAELYAITVPK